MRIITKRERIKGVLKSWESTYKEYKGREGWEDKFEIQSKLCKLDFKICSAEEVKKIIGNDTWTELLCDECEKDSDLIVRFLERYECEYEANPCDLCLSCLKESIKLGKNKK